MSLEQSEQIYSDIKPRLHALEEMTEADLPNEMQNLKKALMQNPDACSLMLPEEVGMLVAALRRITGQALASAKAAKTKTAKPKAASMKSLTAEEIQNALDEL